MPDKKRNRKGETGFDNVAAKAINRSSKYQEIKVCKSCHREFQRRKKWSDDKVWEEMKYCSKKCSSA